MLEPHVDVGASARQYPSMTGLPMDGASSRPRGWQLHRSGPWLGAYGSGPDSEDAAIQARDQGLVRGIDIVLHPIDEVQQVHLVHFTGLVVVLPSQLADPLALRPFARLIGDYRARRPEGLESIINGSCEWFAAGVVQVVGLRAIIQHPAMRTALGRVCARHYTDDSGPLDVFQPYTRRPLLTQQLDEQLTSATRDENIERLCRDVQAWGVTDIQDVPRLRKSIDNFRDYYEDKRFSQLYRPISNNPQNRLDIILDGPDGEVAGNRTTWMENGARVCRNVVEGLKKVVPELTRPRGRNNTKGAQKELRRLYRNLRIIENYMRGPNE